MAYPFVICCLVVFVAHGVQPWDIGVISTYEIQLLDNNTVQKTVPIMWENVTTNTYDSVDDDIYFSEEMTKPQNGTISRFKLTDDQASPEVVVEDEMYYIPDMAFDDRTKTLYWISDKTIKVYKIEKPRVVKPSKGNVLLKLDDANPSEIEIDACNGYLYWINWLTSDESRMVTIERSRLDGSDRKVLMYFDGLVLLSLTVDTGEERLYWAVFDPSKKRHSFSVHSCDLDGGSRRTVVEGLDQLMRGVITDKENLYWLNKRTNSVWKMPKDGSSFPIEIIKFDDKSMPAKIMPATQSRCMCNTKEPQYSQTEVPSKTMSPQPSPILFQLEIVDDTQSNLTDSYSK